MRSTSRTTSEAREKLQARRIFLITFFSPYTGALLPEPPVITRSTPSAILPRLHPRLRIGEAAAGLRARTARGRTRAAGPQHLHATSFYTAAATRSRRQRLASGAQTSLTLKAADHGRRRRRPNLIKLGEASSPSA